MLRYIFALRILHTNCLLDVLFTNISFHFVCCILALPVSFTLQKLSIWWSPNSIFALVSLNWEAYLERRSNGQCQRRCCLSFLLCMVSGLTFRSFMHFEFIFYIYCVRKWSSFILLHVAAWFPNTICSYPGVRVRVCWRDCLCAFGYSFLPCCRLMDHRVTGLYLVSDFHSVLLI